MPLTLSDDDLARTLAVGCRGVAAVYADGGVLGRNPSDVGGTWACCWTGPAALHPEPVRVWEASGHVARADVPSLPYVSNNLTEVVALLLALEPLPAGWEGPVYSDSLNAIRQVRAAAKGVRSGPNFLPPPLYVRLLAAVGRLGPLDLILLGGHPNRAELAAGVRKDGKPVSPHNVACDKAATAAGAAYLASLEAAVLQSA